MWGLHAVHLLDDSSDFRSRSLPLQRSGCWCKFSSRLDQDTWAMRLSQRVWSGTTTVLRGIPSRATHAYVSVRLQSVHSRNSTEVSCDTLFVMPQQMLTHPMVFRRPQSPSMALSTTRRGRKWGSPGTSPNPPQPTSKMCMLAF